MATINRHLLDSLADQASASASAGGGRKALKRWIESNIRHPKEDKPWSWSGHEYQIRIVEETAPWLVVSKPAQVGISELALSMTLGLLAVLPNSNLIYVLHTQAYARTFVTSRFDPAIQRSKKLQALVDKNVDSVSLKKIGSSFLHVSGGHSEGSAISVPASALITDETSFINTNVLGAYASRLEHLSEEEKILIQFGTPLFNNMGVSAIFDVGTQHTRMVYHTKCGTWASINPVVDYIIPGFDDTLDKIEIVDLQRHDIDKAYIKCPHCGNEIAREDLANPSLREWVPKYLERVNKLGTPHSYQIFPHDAAAIKSTAQVIRSLGLYKTTERFFQYGLGLPFDSQHGQVMEDMARKAFRAEIVSPHNAKTLYGTVMGVDIGKTSHLTIGKREGEQLIIVQMETVTQGYDDELQNTMHTRFQQYRCRKGVADSQPDFSSVKAVQAKLPDDAFFGAYFVKSLSGSMLPFQEKPKEGLVAVARTRMFDAFIEDFNKGHIILPKVSFMEEVVQHLISVRKVMNETATGEDQAQYVKLTGVDHWLFSLLFCYTASLMLEADTHSIVLPSATNLVGRVRLRAA